MASVLAKLRSNYGKYKAKPVQNNPMESYEEEEETEDNLVLNLSEPRDEVKEDLNEATCSQDSTDQNSRSNKKIRIVQGSMSSVETSTVQEFDSSKNSSTILADIELQTITGYALYCFIIIIIILLVT